jgi:capsular exopolysaccharide synthesis family protein
LKFAAPLDKLNVLLITSAGPGEGKTFVASNLAVVFAQSGLRVLLVDADLRRPSVHKVFGIENEGGLMALLTRAVHAPSVQSIGTALDHSSLYGNLGAVPTDLENLWLLPAGSIPSNPSIVLGSDAVLATMETIRTAWDIVILDSAPLGPVADSLLLAAHADAALVVARAERTRRVALEQVLDSLRQTGCNVLGVILNDFRLGLIDRYTYGGGYYSDSKHYYGQGDSETSDRHNGRKAPPAAAPKAGTSSDAVA